MGKETRRRERSCWQAARSRAQQARRKGRNRFLVTLIFVMALLFSPSSVPVPGPAPKRRDPEVPGEWPVTEYERGPVGLQHRRQSRDDRYPARPSMRRLMHDLRRPAARADAERVLLARVDDADLRVWVSNHIQKDRINRLSIYVREGIPEEAVIAAWRSDLNAERAAKAEAADEDRERAHLLRIMAIVARKEHDGGSNASKR